MSVVAWDGTTLAADRMANNQGLCYAANKVSRLDDGTLLAITGYQGSANAMIAWYVAGADPETFPKWQDDKDKWSRLIVVNTRGECFWYEQYPYPTPLLNPPMAWGAGQDFALGAMLAGTDARRAVEIANELCDSCGLGVESYDARPRQTSQEALGFCPHVGGFGPPFPLCDVCSTGP